MRCGLDGDPAEKNKEIKKNKWLKLDLCLPSGFVLFIPGSDSGNWLLIIMLDRSMGQNQGEINSHNCSCFFVFEAKGTWKRLEMKGEWWQVLATKDLKFRWCPIQKFEPSNNDDSVFLWANKFALKVFNGMFAFFSHRATQLSYPSDATHSIDRSSWFHAWKKMSLFHCKSR